MVDSPLQPVETRGRSRSLVARPAVLAATGLVLLVAAFHLWVDPENPPGFIRDEASIAYNAYTLAEEGRDQDGARFPLYFVSFGDYKSPLFVYLLAGVFRITGPDAQVARGVAAVVVLLAVLGLGALARRRTGSAAVAVGTIVLAGLTPWIFELGRVAFDTTLEPLVLVLLVLAVDWGYRSQRAVVVRAAPVGLALGALTYVYAAGRLLAPLLAAALLVFAGRDRWRWLVAAWGVYAVTLVPLLLYVVRHPGALTARFEATRFATEGLSRIEVVGRFLSNYANDVNLWHWVSEGDPKPYIHTWGGTGSLLGGVVALAAAGCAVVLLRERGDRFWWFVAAALLLAPVPAAMTEDRFYGLRLLPIPILLVVLAIPALNAIVRAARSSAAGRAVLAVAGAAVGLQFAGFVHVYATRGAERVELFEAGVPALLARAFAGGQTVHVDYDDRYAQTHALWFAVSNGIARERVAILSDGGVPPVGSSVFGRLQECDYACQELGRSYEYWIARAVGPRP